MAKETIYWDKSESSVRLAVVELCGWCNGSGKATPTGKRIAATKWADLSPAAKRILERAGVEN